MECGSTRWTTSDGGLTHARFMFPVIENRTTVPIPEPTVAHLEKFNSLIQREDGCWNWIGPLDHEGYGRFSMFGKRWRAHRVAFHISKGDIPDGLALDHLCRNHRCVNPGHLEAVTWTENMRRGTGASARNIGKTHCPRGHAFTSDNTYIQLRASGRSKRSCLICRRDYVKRRGQ